MMKRKNSTDLSRPSKKVQKMDENRKKSDRRLCLKNVPLDFTKQAIKYHFFQNFPDVSIFMPKNTIKGRTKLVFVTFTDYRETKIAKELINLKKFNHIKADFPLGYEESISIDVPQLNSIQSYVKCNSFDDKICSFCGSIASFVCEVCYTEKTATFYCDESHQTKDWPNHKINCRPLPKLIPISEAVETINNLKEEKAKVKFTIPHVKSPILGDLVVITNVVNGRIIYIRPLKENFESYLFEINFAAQKASNLTEKPKLDDTHFAPKDGKYHRVKVIDELNAESDDVVCFFVDYGYTQKINWQSMKKMQYTIRGKPCHAFKVILGNIFIDYLAQEIVTYLKNLCEAQEALEVIKIMNKSVDAMSVALQRKSNGEIVNGCIEEIGNRNFQNSGCNDESKIIFNLSCVQKLPLGNKIQLRVLDASNINQGFIVCMAAEKFMSFLDLRKELERFCATNLRKNYVKPSLEELCMVEYQDQWERCAVSKIIDVNTIEILLIDKHLHYNQLTMINNKSFEIQNQIRQNVIQTHEDLRSLKQWEQEMKHKEQELRKQQETKDFSNEDHKPPIRSMIDDFQKFQESEESLQKIKGISIKEDNKELELQNELAIKRKDAIELKDKGNMFVKNKDYESAIKMYTKAIDLCSDDAVFYSNRSQCYLSLEKYTECIDDANKAIKLDPTSSKSFYRRMVAYEKNGDDYKALQSCRKLLDLTPDDQTFQNAYDRIHNRIMDAKKKMETEKIRWSRPGSNTKIIDFASKPPHLSSKKPMKRIPVRIRKAASPIPEAIIDKIFDNNTGERIPEPETDSKLFKPNFLISPSPTKATSNISVDIPVIDDKNKLNETNEIIKTEIKKSPTLEELEASETRVINVPTTGSRFFAAWKELNDTQRFLYLKNIVDVNAQVGRIIGAQLNSEILSEIIEIVYKFFLLYNVPYLHLLKDLGNNSEVAMLAMFLQDDEKKKLHELLMRASQGDNAENNMIQEIIKSFQI
ncbi:CLUMA_CG009836, isoform A [Clunio marinus]|uniref:RNA polymerase II-associated protein 3 n=1 Tax=Clunio marinus TaxID=568069 RepID=A0A1J1IA24_9DIPT|nr:CLUMA_CG009836, isoform A [Clunio marinus]